MKILISGSHGLVGSALIPFLQTAGYHITRLIRKQGDGILWNPESGYIDQKALEDFDAIIHLAAENIGSGLWTRKKKEKIKSSRINGTALLAKAIASMHRPPSAFISTSAIGYYGDRGSEPLDEFSAPGNSFLTRVCQDWEKATLPAGQAGVRVVQTRFGLILSPHNGILGRLTLPFKLGLGGKLGSGEQYQPWVAIDDVLAAIKHILTTLDLTGPVNVVAPQTVTNREFTKILARVLNRPVLFSIPALPLKLVLGEMARELLLSSARVIPQKLNNTGFKFKFPQLEQALQFLLTRKK